MKTFTLGIRNILRNKRRTLLTLLAIVSGVTGIVVFGGFIEFAFEGLRESTIRTQLGHVQIYRQGYSEYGVADPAEYLIEEPDRVEAALSTLPHIASITQRLSFSGLISNGNQTITCKAVGVVPGREEAFSSFETILDGQQLEESMDDGGVIGKELANALNARIGDYLTVLTTTLDGIINAVEFRVVGIAQTGSQDYDSVFVKLPLPMVQRAMDTRSVEKILVMLDDTRHLPAFLDPMEAALDASGVNLEYKRWDELAPFYHKVVALYQGMFGVIKVIIGVIVLFSIVNTMTMSVFERVREIGTLRAIGTDRTGVMRLFLTEGLLLGIIGGILGILSGIAAATAINLSGGIPIPPPPGMSRGYVSFILIVPEILLYGFLLTVAVSVLSSIWPAWKASRIKIVEALAHT
uniref:Putative ABC transport system permease protein n=1 Tax=Candidatus Kentrum sp. TUN TaxID=2126343 RepID=A0A450ZNA3_9GAMM|nr:MAG: putative ABC transport system permease protein [Candidatus Kentron sp. TUN]VFK54064.1 MAG: putative ABC transport system permease protein [Candidatus Kentron sp. TUN]VFK55264.1 MAG: putative ABC transport system permease protein [Candidatus Kentron sp. TUN]